MLLRLAPHLDKGISIHICVNKRFKGPCFFFRYEDNVGHPLTCNWKGDILHLAKVNDNKRFYSLIELFNFLTQSNTVAIPRCWSSAFRWTPSTTWTPHHSKPFHELLELLQCYVHEEPPYQLYFKGYGPKPSFTHHKKNMDRYCEAQWKLTKPIQIYTNSNQNLIRQTWKKFVTQHQILKKTQCQTLFQPSSPSPSPQTSQLGEQET